MTTKVAIIETSVCGVKAWHSRCLNCKAETKRRDRQAIAVRDAKAHRCKAEVYQIVSDRTGEKVAWFGKNGSGLYAAKEQAEDAAQRMRDAGQKVTAVPRTTTRKPNS